MKQTVISIALILFLAPLALAQQALPLLTTDAPVGPRDVLQVKVLEEPSVDTARAVVGDDGTITLPLLSKVAVSGLTPSAIEARLKERLEAEFVRKATVSVQVIEYGNRPIAVVGAVTNPGRLAQANLTLIQAITQAGGLAPGYGRELYVLRTADNGLTERLTIDIQELMVNGNPDLNIPLAPNDVINVPADEPIEIYVMGEVMKPGKVDFRRSQKPTVLQAIAAAGGPTDRAGKNVTVKRYVDGKEQTLKYNWRNITRGRAADVTLQDNDTLVIDESLF